MLFSLLTLICVAQCDAQAAYEKANPVLWRPTQIGVAENVLPAVTVAECENYMWCQQIYYGSIIDTLRRNCPQVDKLKVLAPLSSTAVDRSKRSIVAALAVSVVVLVATAAVGIAMAYNKANEATEKVSKVEQDFAVNLKLIKDDNEMSTGIHQRMEEVLKKMSQEMEVIRFDHTLDQVIQQVDSFEVNKRDDANNELLCVYDFVGPVFIMYDHSQNCSKNLSFNLRTENEYLFVYDSNRCYQRPEGIVHWRKMNCLHEKELTDEHIVQIETDAESNFVYGHRQILEVESMMAMECNNTVYKLDKRIAVSVNEIKLPVESNAAVAQLNLQPEVMSYLIGLSFDIVMKGNEEWNNLDELIRKKQKSNEAIKSASFQVIYAFDIYVISTAVVLMLSVIAVLGYFQCEKQERLYEYRFATRGVELTERQRMGQPPSI